MKTDGIKRAEFLATIFGRAFNWASLLKGKRSTRMEGWGGDGSRRLEIGEGGATRKGQGGCNEDLTVTQLGGGKKGVREC